LIIFIGLIVLLAAVVIGAAGVFGNLGVSHALVHSFAAFGYHVTGSNGRLFLYGIVTGAIGMTGLDLLLAGIQRTSARGRNARQAGQDRDILLDQRDAARAYLSDSTLPGDALPSAPEAGDHG
jgi:hypothetical protein